ncbi:MAG TPA: tellurium resistance protein [Rhodobacteraceae bacterium]|jgi:hypothetical protein|nr:tellurium resistance protein [Paracoccaceae bacterium]
MPTASRIIGAIFFAALSWYVSELFKPQMPPGTNFGRFSEYNAAIGLICGWVFMGLRYGNNTSSAVGAGLSAMFATLFWVMLLNSITQMIKLSIRKRYDDPVEAIVGVFEMALKFGKMLLTTEIIATMLITGIVAGLVAGWGSRRWG